MLRYLRRSNTKSVTDNNVAIAIPPAVSQSTISEETGNLKMSTIKSSVKDDGSMNPICRRTCQCQSVSTQYPQPYQYPSPNQENNVIPTEIKCQLLVRRQIQPVRLNNRIVICITKNMIFRMVSMIYSFYHKIAFYSL
jgi:hypothetical protein